MHTAQTLFPSTMCAAFVEVIGLLEDHAVSLDGVAVYEIAYQVRAFRFAGIIALFFLPSGPIKILSFCKATGNGILISF